MNPEGLSPGDKVVALASMCRVCGVVIGLVVGPLAAWSAAQNILISIASALGGAAGGILAGWLIGLFLFPTSAKRVVVVKAGPGALPSTLKGCITVALLTGLLISLSAYIAWGTAFGQVAFPVLGVALIIGVCWGCMAALL